MKSPLFVLLTSVMLLAACHDPERFLLSPTDVDGILSLTAPSTTMSADGVSRLAITATIDGNAAEDARTLEFSTTLGKFVGGTGTGERTATAIADSRGNASVVLISDPQMGQAIVTALVKRGTQVLVQQTMTVGFVAPVADDYFDVTADRTTVPADGVSPIRITVRARLTRTQGRKTFDFTASDGEFEDTGGTTARELTNRVGDDAGTISVVLRSSTRPGPKVVRVTLTEPKVVKELRVEFSTVNIDDVIRVSASNSRPPADGATVTRVTAMLPPGGVDRTVTFTASGGVTISATAIANPDGVAVAFLTSPARPITSEIRATVSSAFTASTSVTFVRALPEQILVVPASATITPGGPPVQIDVTTLRAIGQVTDDLLVTYTPVHQNGQMLGAFAATTLTASGKSSASFVVPAGTPSGYIDIRVRVAESSVIGTGRILGP